MVYDTKDSYRSRHGKKGLGGRCGGDQGECPAVKESALERRMKNLNGNFPEKHANSQLTHNCLILTTF